MSQETNARDLLFRLLLADGARQLHGRKHNKWKLSNNVIFVTSKTPSDHRTWENSIRDLRRAMGEELFEKRCNEIAKQRGEGKTSGRGETWLPLPEPPVTETIVAPAPEPVQIHSPFPVSIQYKLVDTSAARKEASPLEMELSQALESLKKERDLELDKIKRKYDAKIEAFELTLATLTSRKKTGINKATSEDTFRVGSRGMASKIIEAVEKTVKTGEWFKLSDIVNITGATAGNASLVMRRLLKQGKVEARGNRQAREYKKL